MWLRLNNRAGRLTPELVAQMLKAFRVIRESYSETILSNLIATGRIDDVLERAFSEQLLNTAFAPVRERMQKGVRDSFVSFAKDLPKKQGTIGVTFDVLSPDVISAMKELDTKVIQTLKDDVRETVRQRMVVGIQAQETPRKIAKDLRNVIGLAPNQELAVRNFESALRGDGNPLGYKLRDKRFDKTIAKGDLSEDQIQKMTDAYRKRFIAHNASTNARTMALDAQKQGQKLSWQQAIDSGIVDGDRLRKTWVGVKDDRERPEHLAMEGETVPFDQPFSNGEDVPGESTFNCRCITKVFVSRA